MSEWFHNGDAVRTGSLDDRAFQYGDGLFETIAIRGGEPRLWDYHLERLRGGCERLSITMPGAQDLRRQLDDALSQASVERAFCVAKIVVSAGVSRRGYGRAAPAPASTWVGLFASAPVATTAYREGVDTMICNTRLATGGPTAGLKTLNRLEQVLARSECLSGKAFEGITLDADGRVICGTMSNVFLVRKNRLVTPSLERCGVRGVMRRHVIETMRAAGREVEEEDISEGSLRGAEEVFLSNSQFGVLPVRRCDSTEWPVGQVTGEVMQALAATGIAECSP